ncbi:MAG: hypothetical protein A2V99_03290 [Spirochaetes bacterium RBG_16_67_19]|nr:MAG: hypothetical protein A2V99_03290 [Spirochaetes bacterium RBG_16_67_19]
MTVLDDIPFRLDEAAFLRLTRLEGTAEVRGLLERVAAAARPKAAYKVCYVGERGAERVRIEGQEFRSEVLVRNLEEVERVFPYVATCGTELEELEEAGPAADLFARYCLDVLKELALGAARDRLLEHLRTAHGAARLSSMNPGSGDARLWPLGQQRPLVGLLGDVEGAIGVRLTPSLLMRPNKSVSGILFPSEVHFESCQLCTREDCPRRRAPFGGARAHP